MKSLETKLRKRSDKGRYWWELRKCAYYSVFEQTKVFWPDISKYPRFSLNTSETYVNDRGSVVASEEPFILSILQSRAIWLCISQLCVPLGERIGANRYQQKIQFISRLPIPNVSEDEREAIGALAMGITEQARSRYKLHARARNRIFSDLGTPDKKLNQKLTAWWNLDFSEFRAQIKKVFKEDIPLSERDEWEDWLEAQRKKHEQYTVEIMRLETGLNERVYALFDLTPDEIQVIEESTKYQYGEV